MVRKVFILAAAAGSLDAVEGARPAHNAPPKTADPPDDVPRFETYYPSREDMSPEQQGFYVDLQRRLDGGEAPDVGGNISYLFCYAYGLIAEEERCGLGAVAERLLDLAEAYHGREPKVSEYCRGWAYECLLGQGKDAEYLALTEPSDVFRVYTMETTQRLNAAWRLGQPASAVDLFRLVGSPATAFTRRNPTPFRDLLAAVFEEAAPAQPRRGTWLSRLMPTEPYTHYLFSGVPVWPKPALKNYDFRTRTGVLTEIKALAREAENRLRAAHRVPLVGEGWVGETSLFRAVEAAFPETQVVPHGRPEWLGRQHLDIWLPRWKIAVEFHGAQHFEPVTFFGGAAALAASQERDARKARLCLANGVHLVVAVSTTPHDAVVALVRRLRAERPVAALLHEF